MGRVAGQRQVDHARARSKGLGQKDALRFVSGKEIKIGIDAGEVEGSDDEPGQQRRPPPPAGRGGHRPPSAARSRRRPMANRR